MGTWRCAGSWEPRMGSQGPLYPSVLPQEAGGGAAGSKQQEEAVPVPVAMVHLQGGSREVTAPRLYSGDDQDPEVEPGVL